MTLPPTADATQSLESGASRWTAAQLAMIDPAQLPSPAIIDASAARALLPDLFLWDIWPVQNDDGTLAQLAGDVSLWVMLAAPRGADPDARHGEARMRLIARRDGGWHDCGNLLPDGFSPGSREWSGSTRLDRASGRVDLWFTATGRRGDSGESFEQRLFHAHGTLDPQALAITGWRDLRECVANDGTHYADLRVTQGVPGRIKGFRDPYWFRDPADGQGYLLFTGSKSVAQSRSDYDGVIGIATARDGVAGFELMAAILDGDQLVNELERPHMFVHDGGYYLFWSSQSSVFAPDAPRAPTGLYGMVGPSRTGPFTPLNGSGLVLANPTAEPRQAYAWQVLPSLEVVSFVDHWGLNGRDIKTDAAARAEQFGGTIAPLVRIALDGATTRIVSG